MSAPPSSPGPMGWRGLPQNRPPRQRDSDKRQRAQLGHQRRMRAGMVLACITALSLALSYRLVYWQVVRREELLERANRPTLERATAQPRGTIRDRNGYLLATDSVSYKFGVSPNVVSYPEQTAIQVATITGLDASALHEIFLSDAPYTMITDSLPYTVGQQLVQMNDASFVLEPVLNRHYPNGPLAANLLGFVNAERRGLAGVEMYYSDFLNGVEQIEMPDTMPAEEIKLGHRPFTPTRNGLDLILTIDHSVQFMAEQELEQAIRDYQATGGTIIVMDPKTGDILAMTSLPTYDPNNYTTYLDAPEIFQDPAVSQQYEPGSIFKVITVAAALDTGLVSPETPFNDTGSFEVGGRIIRNWDGNGYGTRTVTEILGYSLNTGTAWLNTLLGAERFYRYVAGFGFGQPTGIDLGSEASGSVKRPGDGIWHASDLGTNAFGQGIAVTPIQMITAVASLLNNGQLMQPRVVKAIVNHGHLQERPILVRGNSVSPAIAQTMQLMMADAVEIETKTALVEGWRIGGKTGTAQVPIPGGYHATDTIASFIGFAPADDPVFIVLVKLDRPLGDSQWGSMSAAPTFKRLTQRLLNYYNIAPDQYRLLGASVDGN
ncbi:MAG: penicillin-binding protein 2 [Ardenticatenales bacterium]|nr:penicillin-binding protein 2 [Ardenticatenales bacterium]